MFCDICGNVIVPRERGADRSARVEPATVFVDLCSDDCAARCRAEQSETLRAGSDVTGWIDFDDYELARNVGIIALALILFEGGLAAGYQEVRPVILPAISLAIVGTLVTAGVAGLAAAPMFVREVPVRSPTATDCAAAAVSALAGAGCPAVSCGSSRYDGRAVTGRRDREMKP